ncbi:kinesin-like protein KIN-4C [Tanacetum coccineum]|uniref:Kinesin-like protein n=1 Tax=Tanacetum coccineum TaxID=301880 RepID=A0ABQ4XWL7_9ASTR
MDKMDGSESVRVAVNVRPLVTPAGCSDCISVTPGEPQVQIGAHSFTFDYVYNASSITSSSIFDDCVAPLVDALFHGYNATVLAYGQTGSGKTYMMGTNCNGESTNGIIPKVTQKIFRHVEETKGNTEYLLRVSFIEIYKEEAFDLLESSNTGYSKADWNGKGTGPSRAPIQIRETANGGISLAGVTEAEVTSQEEMASFLLRGSVCRATRSTNMNSQSSRSHAIFTISMEQKRIAGVTSEYDIISAKLHLVDLAGSEQAKKTGADGTLLREGIHINRGLLALGNVISALGDDKKRKEGGHVPYRDSKLTRLLQDSLGGNSKTVMIACVSPADTNAEETLNTLKYANRARNIQNKAIVNRDPVTAQMQMMTNQIESSVLKQHYEKKVQDMEQEKRNLQKEIEQLRCNLANISSTSDDSTQKLKESYLQNLNLLESQVLQRKTEEAFMARKRLKDVLESRKTSRETYGSSSGGPGVQALSKAIEHELEVTVRMHEVRCEFERQKEERLKMAKEVAELKDEANFSKQSPLSHCSQTMSPGARNSRIYALENMLATSSSTIISMASHLSQAEERERAFSGKGRWNHVRSLADAKTVMNNLFNLASSSRCHLWDKEVACREKHSEIRGLKEKIVSLIRQVEMQKAELTRQEKLNAALSDKLAEVNDTKRKPLSDIHNKIVKSNALNTAARKEWRKSVAIQLVSMASDQPYSQTQEPEAPKKQETSTTEPNNFEDEEKELKHCSLQEKLDNELKELDKRPEQKEAEMKRVAGGDTSVLKQHYENSPSWPCFTLVMKALDLKQLYLPKFFSKKLHLKKVKKKGLVVKKNGKEWRIKIYHWEKKNSYFFYGGWPKFIKDNDVTVGDRLKIELVGPELKVSVLRIDELMQPPSAIPAR